MSSPDSKPSPIGIEHDTVEASFALLELCLEQLAIIVPVDSPNQILDLIPEVSLPAKRLILTELVKFDMATAANAGNARALEFYWPSVGEILPQECIPFDLVLEEVQLRRAAGEQPRWDDYRQRFPDLADTIGKWLAGDEQGASVSTSKVPELQVGAQVDDFHVLKLLGQGAFARVYLARQESMQRLVALKATSRGSEEPQALSQLDHANIVRVYDQRTIQEPPTILLYMQYLAGGTLADCIKHVRSIPRTTWSGRSVLDSIDQSLLAASQTVPEESLIRSQISSMEWAEVVAWIGIQLAEGLGYANDKGVLHRDVKPANILLSAEAIPKLADFNVSCTGLSGRAGAAAYFGGSLAYMSPEQLQVADPMHSKTADELDGRSDLYALGIVLWELWQGRRPWTLTDLASSWTQAVVMQTEIRSQDFEPARPASSAAERVLERVLRGLLAVDPDQRPASGKETAARLRLAFYPELANRFEPSTKSFAGRLLSIPVLVISALLIFGPNTAASRFNFKYNHERFQKEYGPLDLARQATTDEATQGPESDTTTVENDSEAAKMSPIERYFISLAKVVNLVVFPLGALLFLLIVLPIKGIVKRAKLGQSASSRDVSLLWNIGYRATLICGVLWAVSGVVFAYKMSSNFPELFGRADAFHFFISLVLCGGVAWIYPYFGMTLLSLLIYYPKVIAPSMSDPQFEQRCERIRRHSLWYLVSAAAIPLTGLGLLVMRESLRGDIIFQGVCITGLGLVVAFMAYRTLEQVMEQYSKVLGDEDRGMII